MIVQWAKKTQPDPTLADLKDKLEDAYRDDLLELDARKILDEYIEKLEKGKGNPPENNNEQPGAKANSTPSHPSAGTEIGAKFVEMEKVSHHIFVIYL